jgi:outer membrane protein
MKRYALLALAVIVFTGCEKKSESGALKTAYVDTSKLLDEYTEARDIEAKYKAKSQEMGKELDAAVAKFKADANSFRQNAQEKGMAWAQQKGAELRQREEQLGYAQQAMLQQLQKESGTEMDSLVSNMKRFIKEYGKEKGYDYIYGTGEAATVLYAKPEYDITSELLKLLNDKYKAQGTKPEQADPKAVSKK